MMRSKTRESSSCNYNIIIPRLKWPNSIVIQGRNSSSLSFNSSNKFYNQIWAFGFGFFIIYFNLDIYFFTWDKEISLKFSLSNINSRWDTSIKSKNFTLCLLNKILPRIKRFLSYEKSSFKISYRFIASTNLLYLELYLVLCR